MLCIPLGPVNLEVFHTALKKHYPQAVAVAAGGALGDAIWAIVAFFGVTPFLGSPKMEAIFYVLTAVITGVLGAYALRESKIIAQKAEECHVPNGIRKRWALLKGLSMVLVNPLGIVSWMICLQFLKGMKFYIPMELRFEILFFIVVIAGALCYFMLVVFITNKMKHFFNPARRGKVTKWLGIVLVLLSAYFIFNAGKVLYYNETLLKLSK